LRTFCETGVKPVEARYLRYFKLFREEKFFEAHEVLEALWRQTKGPDRDFYQGLIQLAAALVHFQKGNFTGAQELFERSECRLGAYPTRYLGVSIPHVLGQFHEFLEIWAHSAGDLSLAKKHLPRVIFKP